MKAFARFKIEIWCKDLAYVDKLAKYNNGVKFLLVRQYLFEATVEWRRLKIKDSKHTVRAFLTEDTKKSTQKILGRLGNRICWRAESYAKLKEFKFTVQ